MNLFYFGASERPLFGAYHPPHGAPGKALGIVVCPPLGVEGLRAQRALRQLATMLAKSGIHVLRFDFYGTGDSSGTCEEGSIGLWLEDIDTARQELAEIASIEQLGLVGLRMGGALAALSAAASPDLNRLVLWDPVVDGAAYVDQIIEADVEYEVYSEHAGNVALALEQDATIGVMGYAVTHAQREEIRRIDLTRIEEPNAEKTFLLVSHESEAFDRLRGSLRERGNTAYQYIPSPGTWWEFDEFGSLLMPQALVQGIVACLR